MTRVWSEYPELADRSRLKRYCDAALTARQIALIVGCSKTSVETAMRRHGLQRALFLLPEAAGE